MRPKNSIPRWFRFFFLNTQNDSALKLLKRHLGGSIVVSTCSYSQACILVKKSRKGFNLIIVQEAHRDSAEFVRFLGTIRIPPSHILMVSNTETFLERLYAGLTSTSQTIVKAAP